MRWWRISRAVFVWRGARPPDRIPPLAGRVAEGRALPGSLDIHIAGRGQREEVGLQARDNAASGNWSSSFSF